MRLTFECSIKVPVIGWSALGKRIEFADERRKEGPNVRVQRSLLYISSGHRHSTLPALATDHVVERSLIRTGSQIKKTKVCLNSVRLRNSVNEYPGSRDCTHLYQHMPLIHVVRYHIPIVGSPPQVMSRLIATHNLYAHIFYPNFRDMIAKIKKSLLAIFQSQIRHSINSSI